MTAIFLAALFDGGMTPACLVGNYQPPHRPSFVQVSHWRSITLSPATNGKALAASSAHSKQCDWNTYDRSSVIAVHRASSTGSALEADGRARGSGPRRSCSGATQ